MPQIPDFHDVHTSTRHDKQSEQKKHGVERQIAFFSYKINEGNRDGEVGKRYQTVRDHMNPDQAPIPHVAIPVGHEIS